MTPPAPPAQQAKPALETGQSGSPQSQPPVAHTIDLRETLAEARETILMVENALTSPTEAKDEQGAKAASAAPAESRCDEEESLIQCAAEVILTEQKATAHLLQIRLRLGYSRATRIMDELERRGVVGPSKGVESREILIDRRTSATDARGPNVEDPRCDALLHACLLGDLGAVRKLLAAGVSVNCRGSSGHLGPTPLHLAAANGHLAVVQELLDHGAEIDATCATGEDQDGEIFEGATPLLFAADALRVCPDRPGIERRSVVQLLISRGANPNPKLTRKPR